MYKLAHGIEVPEHGMFNNYSVDSNGTVSNNKTGRHLKPFADRGGYLGVKLYRDGEKHYCRVHRLVAYNLLNRDEIQEQVDHINGDKTDNRMDNLEFVTRNENMRRAAENGLRPRGKTCKLTKLSEETAREIIIHIFIDHMSPKEVSELTGVHIDTVRAIKQKKAWKWMIKEVLKT